MEIFLGGGLEERYRSKRNETMFGGYKVGSLFIGFMGIPFFLFIGDESEVMHDMMFLSMKRLRPLI